MLTADDDWSLDFNSGGHIQDYSVTFTDLRLWTSPVQNIDQGAYDEAKENDMYDSHQGGNHEQKKQKKIRKKRVNSLLSMLAFEVGLLLSRLSVCSCTVAQDVFKLFLLVAVVSNSCSLP